jgi:hypothetical protein
MNVPVPKTRRRWRTAAVLLSCAVAAAVAAGCGVSQASPSPTILDFYKVAVGSEVSCATPAMARMCDLWVAAALNEASLTASDVSSSVVHVAWRTAPATEGIPVVVVLTKRDGSQLYEPIFCGVSAVPYPPCDLSGVSLPPN